MGNCSSLVHDVHTPDGGTIALDWLTYSDVIEGSTNVNDGILNSDKNPIVVVIPGLTSDSDSAYLKHLAFKMARHGWNVVVINHHGLGGISLTSDCIYNGGWTEDLRRVFDHIHGQYPEAPLYAVGTSIGANILIKYLGEDGVNTPIVGAAAVCSPRDILMCDRFINHRLVQKFYDIELRIGLQGSAQSHKSILAHLVNWEAIETARSVRDVDNHFTRVLGKFETVDAYYRHSSCIHFVGNVSEPLLCISAFDDPVCTREAIPWDECRANENIILATTQHGGHLAFYEGLTAKSLWWVRAVYVFLDVLNTSPFAKRGKSSLVTAVESSVGQGPYISVAEDGMVAAVGTMASDNVIEDTPSESVTQIKKYEDTHVDREKTDSMTLPGIDFIQPYVFVPIRRHMNQLSRRSRISIWLLACIAISTNWPLVDSALILFFKRKFRSFRPKALLRRKKTF